MPDFSCGIINPDTFKNESWNRTIANLPYSHVLQTAEWSQVKCKFGWQRLPVVWKDLQGNIVAAAMILSRDISIPIFKQVSNFIYIPKGPLLDWSDIELRHQVLKDLEEIARNRKTIFVKIDPDVQMGKGESTGPDLTGTGIGVAVIEDLKSSGWNYSPEQIQFKNTVKIDLTHDLEELLARMKQKTRYNLRLAQRKGVNIRKASVTDIPLLFQMYLETSVRDHFVIREREYYDVVWSIFFDADMADALVAEVEGRAVAGVILFRFAEKAWFMFGMSGSIDREKMPNYLLQWESMTYLKSQGCKTYDMWGAPDEFVETDPMWGVYRFKRGLGGETFRHIGAWDLPINKNAYFLYLKILPKVLEIMRWHGRTRARRMLS